jgi:hypothetical protein
LREEAAAKKQASMSDSEDEKDKDGDDYSPYISVKQRRKEKVHFLSYEMNDVLKRKPKRLFFRCTGSSIAL